MDDASIALAVASSNVATVICEADGTLTYANPAFVRMWGCEDPAEVLGRTLHRFIHPEDATQLLLESEVLGTPSTRRSVASQKDGTRFGVLVFAASVPDAQRRMPRLICGLVQADEANQLAWATGSRTHIERQPVRDGLRLEVQDLQSVIKGYLDLARSRVTAPGALAADLDALDFVVDALTNLEGKLGAPWLGGRARIEAVDVEALVTNAHLPLRAALGERIRLRFVTSPQRCCARVEPAVLESILLNLALNARDAMPAGGQLTIETAVVELDEARLALHPRARPGRFVMLAVVDDGSGMTPEVQARAFEPFFSSKRNGEASGLGLNVVETAVKQHEGHIELQSEYGRGTTVRVYLPWVDPEDATPALPPGIELPRGTETILVVERNDHAREFVVRALQRLGYRVLAFRTGDAALDALPATPGRIDLVFSELVMPDVPGRELAARLRARHPGMRVLFASRGEEEFMGEDAEPGPDARILTRPYSLATLAHRVRATLDRPPHGS